MIVVMGANHTRTQIDYVVHQIEEAGLRSQITEGVERTVIGVVGDSHTKELLRERLEAMPGVESVVRILQPYKLVSREFHAGRDSTIWVGPVAIGGGRVVVIAGPCSVESREQALETAHAVKAAGAQLLRGGAFKPRTSPYDFQGLKADGLKLLGEARAATISSLPPMVSSPTVTSVSSGFTSRLTSLKGWLTGMASATPGIIRNGSGSSAPLLPVMPTAVRVAPGMTWGT